CYFEHNSSHSFPTRRSYDLKVIPHFAHQQSLNCSKNGGESLYHMKGKLQIYQWLRSQYKHVYTDYAAIDIFVISLSYGRDFHHRSEEHTSELQSRFDLVCRL